MDEHTQQVAFRGTAIPGARFLALLGVCLGTLMVVLDGSIVYVALPTIGSALGLPTNSLIWVVNGYAIPYGGFLLLSGRLGDYYGHRRLFLLGIILFTLASLACALAETPAVLIGGRAVQGAAAAIVSTVSVSSVMQDFESPSERAQVMAVYSTIVALGASAGMLIGGFVIHALSWRWLFLINLPVGIVVCALFALIRFERARDEADSGIDFAGAGAITTSLLLATSSALNASDAGWLSVYTWGPFAVASGFFALFVKIETRARCPLVPLALLRERNLRVSVGVGALWGGATSVWSLMSALYLQRVVGYDALQLALAFLPAPLIIGLFSFGLSARLVRRFGSRILVTIGVALDAAGLLLLARTPATAVYGVDVLPSMLLTGVGTGLASGPYFLIALSRVRKDDYGVASAILNSSSLLGGAIALAVVAGQAAARNEQSATYSVALCAAALLGAGAAFLSRYTEE